jgi:hypothetical protein
MDSSRQSKVSKYAVLPPIDADKMLKTPRQTQLGQKPFDFLSTPRPLNPIDSKEKDLNPFNRAPQHQDLKQFVTVVENPLNFPMQPVHLSFDEEISLLDDIKREMGNYSVAALKQFYTALLEQDPNQTTFLHHSVVLAQAKKVKVKKNC